MFKLYIIKVTFWKISIIDVDDWISVIVSL